MSDVDDLGNEHCLAIFEFGVVGLARVSIHTLNLEVWRHPLQIRPQMTILPVNGLLTGKALRERFLRADHDDIGRFASDLVVPIGSG